MLGPLLDVLRVATVSDVQRQMKHVVTNSAQPMPLLVYRLPSSMKNRRLMDSKIGKTHGNTDLALTYNSHHHRWVQSTEV